MAACALLWCAAPAGAHSPAISSPVPQGHPYRRGLVPMRGRLASMQVSAASPQVSANDLNYGGGVGGVGVDDCGTSASDLVFLGSQWGTQSSNGTGYATFSGDPLGMAADLQAFLAGLGTGGETWSGVMTQYCEGVAAGARTCPPAASHVGYPTGGALAGVWEDSSSAEPSAATAHQLAAEAVDAAIHFGNTTAASNRNAQYVIVSATGTNPDSYQTAGFCAWHDYTGDSTLDGGGADSTPWGTPIAFTNLPYIPDAGNGCGQNFVNAGSAGTLDGVTIVEGAIYAETITDQFPSGGWTDSARQETGDKCAFISSGQGASQDISLTTGSFAMQSTWANDFNGGAGGCEISHPIVTADSVSVTNPGNQSGSLGTAVSLQIQAIDASGENLTYSAVGLPSGLSISSSTGLISGTPAAAGSSTVTVMATDASGASASAVFTWTIARATTTTALRSSANPSFSGEQVTYTATVTPDVQTSVPPTGTVSFADGTNVISGCGSAPVTGGQASCSVTYTGTAGSQHPIAAVYGGDTNFTGSSSPTIQQQVDRAATTLTAARARRARFATTFSATLTRSFDGTPLAGKQIWFSVQSRRLCRATTNSSGLASCTFSWILFTFATTYNARFAGDSDYQPSDATTGSLPPL